MKYSKQSIVLISFLFAGCSFLFNPYKIVNDEFKNCKTITVEQSLLSTEWNSVLSGATITVERKISTENEVVNLYFVLTRKSTSFNIEKKAYLKANGENYEINLENESSEYRTQQQSNTTSTTTKDSTKVKTEYKTETKNYDWYEDKFIVRLSPQQSNSLKITNEILIRFYFGPEQATFIIKGHSLEQIQKLLVKEL